MRIIAFKTLKEFYEKHEYSNAEVSLRAWYHDTKTAEWKNSNEMKKQYKNTSIVGDGRVFFNIKGNDFEELWGAKKDSPEGDELDLLVTLVESYEMKHYPLAPPDPIGAIIFRMEQMEMTNADMIKYMGSQSRVSEILNKKRKLTLGMMKSLYKDLKIPADILLA